jgi:hypothetical protein
MKTRACLSERGHQPLCNLKVAISATSRKSRVQAAAAGVAIGEAKGCCHPLSNLKVAVLTAAIEKARAVFADKVFLTHEVKRGC